MKKINIAVLFGGKSSEHQISLLSAKSVLEQLSQKKYSIFPIGVDKSGRFFLFSNKEECFLNENDPKRIRLSKKGKEIFFHTSSKQHFWYLDQHKIGSKIDLVFPLLHGTGGEDGLIQGFFETLRIPYVGSTVLGSSVGMDKDVSKRLLKEAGIPIAEFQIIHIHEKLEFQKTKKKFGLPFFLKPSSSGSSCGVHKVKNEKEFENACKDAFLYGEKILVEKMIIGKEIECAVLGNDQPIISLPGALESTKEFYSYEAKYLDEHGAKFEIPIHLEKRLQKDIQEICLKTYKILECRGLARIDGFLQSDGTFFINEINTLPGFTKQSMYPKLWEVSGIPYCELLDRLIHLALSGKKT